MSLNEFWLNVRTGARFVAPTAAADSPFMDAAEIERRLRRATTWLTPESVNGFREEDFSFLNSSERRELADAVTGFRTIARRIPPDQPATDQQIREALPHFLRIFTILRPDKYNDPEALVLGKQVEQRLAGSLPEAVLDLRFETGEDVGGQPALWIWVILKDEAVQGDALAKNTQAIRQILHRAVRELGFAHWPYVHFRTASELQYLQREYSRKTVRK